MDLLSYICDTEQYLISEELYKKYCHVEAEVYCGKEEGKYEIGSLEFRLQGGKRRRA